MIFWISTFIISSSSDKTSSSSSWVSPPASTSSISCNRAWTCYVYIFRLLTLGKLVSHDWWWKKTFKSNWNTFVPICINHMTELTCNTNRNNSICGSNHLRIPMFRTNNYLRWYFSDQFYFLYIHLQVWKVSSIAILPLRRRCAYKKCGEMEEQTG